MMKVIPSTVFFSIQLSYLLVVSETLCIAHWFAATFHLQHERFDVAEGFTVCTASHGQVVHGTEALEAGVTAELMDAGVQDHLMFALQRRR